MFEAAITEFPFVAEMPRRDKTRYEKVWDSFQRVKAITDKEGAIWPVMFVAKILGVSNERVHELMKNDRLKRVEVDGHPFVTEVSMLDYAKSERKAGRPCGPRTVKDCAKVAVRAGRDYRAQMRAK